MTSSPEIQPRSRMGWNILRGALVIEAFGGLALLVPTVLGLLSAVDEPLGDRLAVFFAVLIAWVWVLVTLIAGLRSRVSWVRGSAITIHVLLFAAGTGMLQQGFGSTLLAFGVVLLALIGFFAALMAKPELAVPDSESDTE